MIGKGLVVLFVGLVARIGGAMLITSKQRYNFKEQIFISIAWIPKATVQAAIGGIILTTAEEAGTSASK
jgi:NhaP-type Na+/H+ or K+/H+ antiporter